MRSSQSRIRAAAEPRFACAPDATAKMNFIAANWGCTCCHMHIRCSGAGLSDVGVIAVAAAAPDVSSWECLMMRTQAAFGIVLRTLPALWAAGTQVQVSPPERYRQKLGIGTGHAIPSCARCRRMREASMRRQDR